MNGAGVLTVLSRQWCHLCHELVEALQPLAAELGYSVTIIDIDEHPELEERWNELVPAVLADDVELCHHRLDEAAVRAYCAGFPLESAP